MHAIFYLGIRRGVPLTQALDVKFLGVLTILIAAISGCSPGHGLSLRTALDPGSKYQSSVVHFFVTNNTSECLSYSDAILFDFKRPEGDLSLAITDSDGTIKTACNPADYFRSPVIRQLRPEMEVDVAEAADIVSGRYCLKAGQTYNLRVIYSSKVGSELRVIHSSNSVPFIASSI